MTLSPAYSDDLVTVYHCDHAALAAHLRETGERADALIVDAPYSERTHAGHDEMAARSNERTGGNDRGLGYAPWSQADVAAFVATWSPLAADWLVSLTDEHLRAAWREEYERAGRVAFPRVPSIETGSNDRKQCDGPASWCVDVVVGRTQGKRHIGAWRPRPYYLGPREAKPWVGGKPLWLMESLVRDYSREGDLVCDPCMGGGTTAIAAMRLGRRFVGCDVDEAAVTATIERVREERRRAEAAGRQVAMWQPPRPAKRARQSPLGI